LLDRLLGWLMDGLDWLIGLDKKSVRTKRRSDTPIRIFGTSCIVKAMPPCLAAYVVQPNRATTRMVVLEDGALVMR
jgi:hypothetical protein